MIKWFNKVYAPFIIKARFIIIAFFVLLLIYLAYNAQNLGPAPEPPKFLSEDNNFGGFNNKKADLFLRGGTWFDVNVIFMAGIEVDVWWDDGVWDMIWLAVLTWLSILILCHCPQDPIDRSGTLDTDPLDRGVPNYNSVRGFYFASR